MPRFYLSYFTIYLKYNFFTSSGIIGYYWCLFVEYHIHRNFARIKKKSRILAIPLIIATILIFINLLGTGIIFDISKENVYTRGPMNFILYIFVFVYYIESIYTVQKAKADSILVEFFPIYYFIIPCMIGTMIQGFFFQNFYGLALCRNRIYLSLH